MCGFRCLTLGSDSHDPASSRPGGKPDVIAEHGLPLEQRVRRKEVLVDRSDELLADPDDALPIALPPQPVTAHLPRSAEPFPERGYF